jgi:hypothetical protein
VTGPLATVLIVVSLLLAGWALVRAALNRALNPAMVTASIAVEAALVVQLLVAVVLLVRGERPADGDDLVTFLAYLAGSLVVLPAGVVLGISERSRYGSLVLAVAALGVPVMVVRMQQLWEGTGV